MSAASSKEIVPQRSFSSTYTQNVLPHLRKSRRSSWRSLKKMIALALKDGFCPTYRTSHWGYTGDEDYKLSIDIPYSRRQYVVAQRHRQRRRARAQAFPEGALQKQGDAVLESDNQRRDGVAASTSHGVPLSLSGPHSAAKHGGAAAQDREKQRKLWLAALKPPLYSVAVAPVLVGSATAFAETGLFHADRFFSLLGGAIFVIAWLNLSNDSFDAVTGVDKNKPESIVNLTGGRAGPVLAASLAFLAAGAQLLYSGFSPAEDVRCGAALALAVALGYAYQGPPFRLSYKGLGEPICFVTFGPLATLAFHLAMAGPGGTVGTVAASSSALVGSSIAVILFCSHFHQIEGDLAAGKASPLTRLGLEQGLQVLQWWVVTTEIGGVLAPLCGLLPWQAAPAMLLAVPQALHLLSYGKEHLQDLDKLKFLKLQAVKWQMALSLLLAGALVSSRVLA
eukprot:jgi/Botrbrau1/2208/Bobra.101_2s0038.1